MSPVGLQGDDATAAASSSRSPDPHPTSKHESRQREYIKQLSEARKLQVSYYTCTMYFPALGKDLVALNPGRVYFCLISKTDSKRQKASLIHRRPQPMSVLASGSMNSESIRTFAWAQTLKDDVWRQAPHHARHHPYMRHHTILRIILT
jgi:hypothetical protein